MTARQYPQPSPDLVAVLAQLEPVDRSSIPPETQRAEYVEFVEYLRGPEPAFSGKIAEETLFLGESENPVSIRHYVPDDDQNPGHKIIYFHGGGWVLGSADTQDRFTRALSERLRLHVISVNYRLAPEHRFPAAFDDCERVVIHFAKHAQWLAVGGDSAGGNLAAAVSARRAAAGVPVDAQILIYPGLDVPNGETHLDGLGLDRSDIDYFWSSYCGNHEVDERLAPLLAPDPLVVPPTLVTTAGCDPLAPDGIRYAQRTIAAGIPTIYLPFPGLIHGWLDLAEQVPSAASARDSLIEAVRQLHAATSKTSASGKRADQ